MLEREDELGGCIRTAELTEPGYLHDVFSAWHPLWVGGAAHAELGDELAARGLEYLNTDHPTATLTPERRGHLPAPLDRGQRRRARRGVARARSSRSCRTPTSPSACSAPSCGRATGIKLGLKAYRRLGRKRRGRVHRRRARLEPRLAHADVRVGARARRARAVGAAHGPRPRRRGLRVHDAGDRRRGAGGRHADPARRRGEARRGARAPDRGPRRRVRDRPRRRAGARARRQGDGRAHSPTGRRSRRSGR